MRLAFLNLIVKTYHRGNPLPRKQDVEGVHRNLTEDPLTPSEMAGKLGISYRTAEDCLMHIAFTRMNVTFNYL
jgi:hypothetical protein